MSKAFTRESDDSEGEEIALRPQLPAGARNYITADGAKRLKDRLEKLIEKKQGAVESEVESRKLESAIRNLKQRLDSVVIVERPADPEKVAVGAVVQVRHSDGQEDSYWIVGVEESAPDRGAISWISPLAKALLSRKAGEKVRIRLPMGEDELEILSVRY